MGSEFSSEIVKLVVNDEYSEPNVMIVDVWRGISIWYTELYFSHCRLGNTGADFSIDKPLNADRSILIHIAGFITSVAVRLRVRHPIRHLGYDAYSV